MGQFGKQIQSNQIPGWTAYYLDYKGLKQIVKLVTADQPHQPLRPIHILSGISLPGGQAPFPSPPQDDRNPLSKRFLNKLQLEREKVSIHLSIPPPLLPPPQIDAFYLQKEKELKSRLSTLLSKRQVAAHRLPDAMDEDSGNDGAEWRAVEEGFRLLRKDLDKLQQFIEINATGFRKILKKWDKKSRTNELYLARQLEIQPSFNRQLLAELSDIVATCLLDLSSPSSMAIDVPPAVDPTGSDHVFSPSRIAASSAFRDLESKLSKAVAQHDVSAVRQVVAEADSMSAQPDSAPHVTRILWKAAIEAIPPIADIIMSSRGYDIRYVDDINGRTCLHGAAIAGELRLLDLCVQNGLEIDRVDFYGRSALHYASMNGHDHICQRLLSLGADPRIADKDNYTPLIYAIISGKVPSVQVLLQDPRVRVEPSPDTPDLIPLSLACQFGHSDVVSLLLQRGARKSPNSSGQYPLHLAAREGHAELCRMLLHESGGEGKDIPDKYNEWTPLFHAARNGHPQVIQVLLEAGCNPYEPDEMGATAVFYAAWFGFVSCVELLLRAMDRQPTSTQSPIPSIAHRSRKSNSTSPPSDLMLPHQVIEGIPSLTLPPPIMPFTIYGHNYLDKTFLVQVVLRHPDDRFSSSPTTRKSPVELSPVVSGLNRLQFNPGIKPETALKVVVTPKLDTTSAPHTITLPLADDSDTFSFQLRSLDDLTLEFSFYPSFGNKAIGRAVVLPGALRSEVEETGDVNGGDGVKSIVLPILDHRLLVIGQIMFETCIITHFPGLKLEVGGTEDRYWKSTAGGPSTDLPPSRLVFGSAPSSSRSPGAGGGSASISSTNSPSTRSGLGIPSAHHGSVVVSSLSGEYVHVIVQVTRDCVPVVCPIFRLPVDVYDLGVADLTASQFLSLARNAKADFERTSVVGGVAGGRVAGAQQWHAVVKRSLMTLEQLLKVLPLNLGVCLELAFPTKSVRQRYNLGRGHRLNTFVDAVLKTVFDVSTATVGLSSIAAGKQPANPSAAPGTKRKVVFTSFEPNVCVAVNWKQPNYAVFFSSDCGLPSSRHSNDPATGDTLSDPRCASLDAAVNCAKANNLLGILINASLLVRIPSLIPAIKDSGVLLAAYGKQDQLSTLSAPTAAGDNGATSAVDGILQDGVLSYLDHFTSARSVP
ncbi:ubiquitin-protein ligase peroxin 12 [Tulasnella sp. 403]|nr:ubiquitin-protein ligase peroxin 12 [Tulasnella sp. 403]